jgi:hypothetical protein
MASIREAERQKTQSDLQVEDLVKEEVVDVSAVRLPYFKAKEEEPDDGFPSIEFDEEVEIVKFKYFTQVGKLVSCFSPKLYSGRHFIVFRKMFVSNDFKAEMNAFIRASEYLGVPYDRKIYKEMLMPWNNILKNRAKQEILKRKDEPINHRVSQMIAKFNVPEGYKVYKKTEYAHRLILDFGIRLKKINTTCSTTQVIRSFPSSLSASAFTAAVVGAATSHTVAATVQRQDRLMQGVLDRWTFTPNSSAWRSPTGTISSAGLNDSLDNSDDEDDDEVPLTTYFYCCANDACRKKPTVIPIKKFVPRFAGQIDRTPECANVFEHLQDKHWNMLLQCGYTVDPKTGMFTGDLKRHKNTRFSDDVGAKDIT